MRVSSSEVLLGLHFERSLCGAVWDYTFNSSLWNACFGFVIYDLSECFFSFIDAVRGG